MKPHKKIYRCPKCDGTERFEVLAANWITIDSRGTIQRHDTSQGWCGDDAMLCCGCDFQGSEREFVTEGTAR